ncbi:MAG: His/Gly/Thr/Pro-type tRNA ligase C-terminal domain-containing protein, partial [Ilumatobacteraceae bacterium]
GSQLRAAGIGADRAYDARSMKSQMKVADRSGARLALIVGEDEVAKNAVTLRTMETGAQQLVPRDELVAQVKTALGR